jgi:hypothetical protein
MASTKLASTVRTAFTQDGAVVMEIKKGLVFSSNPVAGRMLELLLTGATHEKIGRAIAAEWGVEVEIVFNDLKTIATMLEECGVAEARARL